MLSALTTRLEDLCNRVDAGQEREHELQGQLHATEAEYAAMDAYVEEVQRQARGLRVANEYNDVREAAMEALIASVRAAEMSRETLHARLERLANDVGHHKSVNRALAEAKALTERALALTKVRGGVQASYSHDAAKSAHRGVFPPGRSPGAASMQCKWRRVLVVGELGRWTAASLVGATQPHETVTTTLRGCWQLLLQIRPAQSTCWTQT